MRHGQRLLACMAAVLLVAFAGGAMPVHAQSDYLLDADLQSDAARTCRTDVAPPAPRTTRAPDAMRVLPPPDGAYLGLYQIPPLRDQIEAFAAATGGMPPIVFTFHDWYADTNSGNRPSLTFDDPMEGQGNVPPLVLAEWLRQRGSVMALAWAVYCCDIESTLFWLRLRSPHDHFNRILRGEHDAFIRATARRIRDWGGPIMLTLVPEMDWQGQFAFGANGRRWMDAVDDICGQYGDPAWPDGPERIRDLFIHVIDIFREEGAENVTWFMYSGNQYMVPGVDGQSMWLHPRFYYPGDAYIDWVGQSVYFIDPAWNVEFEDVGSFDAVFRPGYEAWRSVTSRPLLLAEFGILAEPTRDRRDLWQRVFGTYLRSVPGVRAVTVADSDLFELYFNIPRVSTRPEESALLRRMMDDPYFTRELRVGPPAAQ